MIGRLAWNHLRWGIVGSAVVAAAWQAAAAADISGAGATFPAPLYAAWAAAYKERTGIDVEYLATGSGAGIKRIEAKEIDFAATDAPLNGDEQAALGLAQFPIVVGGVVPVINMVGIKPGGLRLDGEVLADIYLGHVVRWNDRAIAALNPGLALPDSNITVVHRGDASGTTFLWTDYLAKRSSAWRARIGATRLPTWPVGVAGKGNEGVASLVQRTRMSIGYVEFAYAKKHRLSHASLRNKEGNFVQPARETFAAAVASADWTLESSFHQVLTDAPGTAAWPITGLSFILLRTPAEQAERSLAVLKFFDWALTTGQALAEGLDYVALPSALAGRVERAWQTQMRDASGRAIWGRPTTGQVTPN